MFVSRKGTAQLETEEQIEMIKFRRRWDVSDQTKKGTCVRTINSLREEQIRTYQMRIKSRAKKAFSGEKKKFKKFYPESIYHLVLKGDKAFS